MARHDTGAPNAKYSGRQQPRERGAGFLHKLYIAIDRRGGTRELEIQEYFTFVGRTNCVTIIAVVRCVSAHGTRELH